MTDKHTYRLAPLNDIFGAIVTGVDLSEPEAISEKLKEKIKADVHKHRLLLFKNDGTHISAEA